MSNARTAARPPKTRTYQIDEFILYLREKGWEVAPFYIGKDRSKRKDRDPGGLVGVRLRALSDLFILGQMASEGGHVLPCPILVQTTTGYWYAVFEYCQWPKTVEREQSDA